MIDEVNQEAQHYYSPSEGESDEKYLLESVNVGTKRSAMPDTPNSSPKLTNKRKMSVPANDNNQDEYIQRLENSLSELREEYEKLKLLHFNKPNIATSNAFSLLAQSDQVEMDISSVDAIPMTSPKAPAYTSAHISDGAKPGPSRQVMSFTKAPKATPLRPTAVSPSTSVPSNNRSDAVPSTSATTQKPRKPPPIVVLNLDCKAMSENLKQTIGSNAFSFRRVSKETTHILTTNITDHKIVKQTLEGTSTSFHSFTPKEEQQINIVLRHLDSTYDEADVLASIESLQLDIVVSKVMLLPTKHNHLWLIQLNPGSDAKQLVHQRHLLNQTVVFEYKKNNGMAQCKKCQLFGHSARNCHHKYRCVKCTDTHLPGQCPRTLTPHIAENTLPSCVNCQATDHPANFRGCPAYLNVLKRKQQQNTQQDAPAVQTPHITQLRTPNVSYAAALNSTANARSQPHANPFDIFETECQNNFNMSMSELHAKAKQFYPSFVALPADKRGMALINFVLSLSA